MIITLVMVPIEGFILLNFYSRASSESTQPHLHSFTHPSSPPSPPHLFNRIDGSVVLLAGGTVKKSDSSFLHTTSPIYTHQADISLYYVYYSFFFLPFSFGFPFSLELPFGAKFLFLLFLCFSFAFPLLFSLWFIGFKPLDQTSNTRNTGRRPSLSTYTHRLWAFTHQP